MRLRSLILATAVLAIPSTSFSQGDSRVVVIPSAVIAFQPADKSWGSPYLTGHLGGLGWGASLAVLAERGRFVVGGEINSARYEKELSGRLVSSLDENHVPIPVRVTFQESIVAALFGYSGRNIHVLGGPGVTLGTPQFEGRNRSPDAPDHWFVLTGGLDVFLPASRQMQFAIGARYFHIFGTSGRFSTLGLQDSGLRATVGVSFGSAK